MPTITRFSVTKEVAPERSMALTSTIEHTQTDFKTTRATGSALKVFGALSAWLRNEAQMAAMIRKKEASYPDFTLEVIVHPDVIDEVKAAAFTGIMTMADSVHLLRALHDKVQKFTSLGGNCIFTPGEPELSEGQKIAFDERLASELKQYRDKLEKIDAWQLPSEDANWVKKNKAQVVYTDGSCHPESGMSAWAYWVDENTSASGVVAPASSSYAERRAALEALKATTGPVLIVTDFTGLVPDLTDRVRHADEARVIKSLRSLMRGRQVRILVVKGHTHCPGNIAVDAVAGETLSKVWMHLSATKPEVYNKLVAITKQRYVTIKERRAEAQERRERHIRTYGSTKLRRKARRRRLEQIRDANRVVKQAA